MQTLKLLSKKLYSVYTSLFSPLWLSIVSNALEHYDKAIFPLLNPFIAMEIFRHDPLPMALSKMYLVSIFCIFFKPLGNICFTKIAKKYGKEEALFLALTGSVFSTFAMGFLPYISAFYSYHGGVITFAVIRIFHNFFFGGEKANSSTFIQFNSNRFDLLMRLYDMSSIYGWMLASVFTVCIAVFGDIERQWSWLFWVSGIFMVLGVMIKKFHVMKDYIQSEISQKKIKLWTLYRKILIEHKESFLLTIIASSFHYITYNYSLVIMYGYIPLTKGIKGGGIMSLLNTFFFYTSVLSAPSLRHLFDRMDKETKLNVWMSFSVLFGLFIFLLPQSAIGVFIITLIRLVIIIGSLGFITPYYLEAQKAIPSTIRLQITAAAHSIGTQIIGNIFVTFSFWLYGIVGLVGSNLFYCFFFAIASVLTLWSIRSLK